MTRHRCNYCGRPSVVRFRYAFQFSRMGAARVGTVTVQSCAEHEGCVNWRGCREVRPDSPLERFDSLSGKWAVEEYAKP